MDVVEAVTTPLFWAAARRNCGGQQAPIIPHPLRNHGAFRPKSLAFLNLDFGGVGRRVSLPGMEMSNRSARFVSAVIASILAGANFTAIAENAPKVTDNKAADTKPADSKAVADKAADACLSGPKGSLPAGGHWYYHVDRATKRTCWYIGEEKGKTAKAAPPAQDPSSSANASDSAPPPQPSASLRKSVADARAELTSPQTNVAQDASAGIGQQTTRAANVDNSPRASAANADTQSSMVSSRWPEASSVPPSGSFQLAAANASASAQADTQPAPPPAVTPAAPAATGSALDRQSYSTQMLLLVMASALALAGLVSAVIVRLNRTRKPAGEFRSEWPAPWDSIHSDLAPQPMFRLQEAPAAPAEAPTRREHSTRREHPLQRENPMRRATASRDPRAPDDPDRRIAEMLQRLARSAAT